MPKASLAQTAFTAGELTPQALGRQDLEKYPQGMSVCLNGFPLIQGPWTRRPGTLFLKTTKFGGAKQSRALPFNFGVSQSYVLEFGDLYVRFFTLQGILTNTAQAIEGVTQADPGVLTLTGHGYSDGDRLHLSDDVGGMHQLRLREVVVANSTVDDFELTDIYGANIDTSGYDAFTSGGTVGEVFEVVTPYQEADLPLIKIRQTADLLYIFHPDYETRTLTRLSATSWTLSTANFDRGPYDIINETATTLTPSATTGAGITVTASSVTGINEGLGFLTTDVGRSIRIQHGLQWGLVTIVGHTSTTVVTADVVQAFGAATASTEWRLGLFSETTGYPSAGSFYEDRLWVGGADLYTQNLSGSRTGRYTNFTPSSPADSLVADDHAIEYVLNSGDVNAIRWLADNEKALLVGTAGGEWVIRPSASSEAVTPSNISGKRATRHGSTDLAPVETGFSTLFLQNGATKLREIVYSDSDDGFTAPDVAVLAEHITRPSMLGTTYQRNPQSIVYGWRSDGVLVGFTYEPDAGVYAWHRHILGGDGDASGGHAVVESAATIPSPTGDRDETYLIVKRYINGQTERYVELMTKIWETGDDAEDAFHLDCGLTTVSVGGTTELLGLWHLEGEELTILLDGANHAPKTVTNGKITLDVSGNIATYGFPYNSDGKPMPLIGGSADGSPMTKKTIVNRIGFWLLDTLGLKFGPDEDNLTEIIIRRWGESWGVATPLFTGVVREEFEGDHDRVAEVFFRANGPFPATVLAVTTQINTQDDT